MELGVSYFGNRILRHFVRDIEDIKAHHCTYVVHTYSENDQIFCKQAVKEMIAATKDAGLGVWVDPWGVGRVFGGEAFSNFTATNPDSVQIANDGIPTHCACPNAPKFRQFMTRWVADAAEIGAEMLFWDEPHFYNPSWLGGRPGTWACRCVHCHAAWEQLHPGVAFPSEMTAELEVAREHWLQDFLRHCTAESNKVGIPSAVCFLPKNDDHPNVAENWEAVAEIPGIVNVGTDPYWLFSGGGRTIDNYVRPMSQRVVNMANQHKKASHLWLQGFKIPGGREHELIEAVEAMAATGCRNIAVWGFDACRHLSWIRPDNPDLVWKTVAEAFARVKDLK